MILKTGFGILIKNGKKLKKFELTPGMDHAFGSEFTVQEVSSREELDRISLDKSDEQLAYETVIIQKKSLRDSAKSKIRAIVTTLTDDELNVLFGV